MNYSRQRLTVDRSIREKKILVVGLTPPFNVLLVLDCTTQEVDFFLLLATFNVTARHLITTFFSFA